MNIDLIIKGPRIAFCQDLIKAKSLEGGKPRFTAQFILDQSTPEGKEALKQVKAAIAEIAKTEFKGKVPAGKDCALRDGDDNIDKKADAPYNGFAGNMYLSGARAEQLGPPLVVGRKIVTETANGVTRPVALHPSDESFPRAGDFVVLKCSIYSMGGKNDKPTKFGAKICCQIETVQFMKRGEALAGGGPANVAGLEDMPDEEVEDARL